MIKQTIIDVIKYTYKHANYRLFLSCFIGAVSAWFCCFVGLNLYMIFYNTYDADIVFSVFVSLLYIFSYTLYVSE